MKLVYVVSLSIVIGLLVSCSTNEHKWEKYFRIHEQFTSWQVGDNFAHVRTSLLEAGEPVLWDEAEKAYVFYTSHRGSTDQESVRTFQFHRVWVDQHDNIVEVSDRASKAQWDCLFALRFARPMGNPAKKKYTTMKIKPLPG